MLMGMMDLIMLEQIILLCLFQSKNSIAGMQTIKGRKCILD